MFYESYKIDYSNSDTCVWGISPNSVCDIYVCVYTDMCIYVYIQLYKLT